MHDIAGGREGLVDELLGELNELEGEFGTEYDEMESELAEELLSLDGEQELDQFFGKVVRGLSRAARSRAGRMLTGALRGVAKKALPLAGKAVGGAYGGPIGAALGGQAGALLGSLFELENMSDEDAELEVAKRVVRVAKQATQQLSRDSQATSNPRAAVQAALGTALRAHLPGLAAGAAASHGGGSTRSGRWIRRGNNIVLLGA